MGRHVDSDGYTPETARECLLPIVKEYMKYSALNLFLGSRPS